MNHRELREAVCEANREISRAGLVVLTWGNASAVDRGAGVMAIKPSGVGYDSLKPEDLVIQAIGDGRVVEGRLRPSSDAPTHLHLYRSFEGIGGIVHTHSTYATSWAQACAPIPCQGTTHADHFRGSVPVARELSPKEIGADYEAHTGVAIVDRFRELKIDPLAVPAVLVPRHAPFVWGRDMRSAVDNAIALEQVARMALYTRAISPDAPELPRSLLDKHFLRKHGPSAYYGQP
jgi:L-ribulose-5-phosphate 4-epimerase